MKNVSGILIALALVLSQPFGNRLVAGAMPNCGCKMTQCCMAGSKAPAQETPAIPVTNSSLKDFQVVVSPICATPALPQISDAPRASASAAFFFARSVPLFTRDCALLL